MLDVSEQCDAKTSQEHRMEDEEEPEDNGCKGQLPGYKGYCFHDRFWVDTVVGWGASVPLFNGAQVKVLIEH
jgi:hypothetical protein